MYSDKMLNSPVEVTRNTDERHVGDVHGYPSASKSYNEVYDVRKKPSCIQKNEKRVQYALCRLLCC